VYESERPVMNKLRRTDQPMATHNPHRVN